VNRRRLLAALIGLLVAPARAAEKKWYEAAEKMRQLAIELGDQAYGAVLVADDRIIGEAPSRVRRRNDPEAHAEREAIREALRRAGPEKVAGSVLYSTARPCRFCERAAANAGVARMIAGAELRDLGAPRP
jgi:tRNA(adenine34) deaminase